MECDKHIGFEIQTLSNLIKRYFDQSVTEKHIDKITGLHRRVIGYLYRNQDRDIFQRDLEMEFSIRRSTATVILQLMEKNTLITRQSVDYDKRLKKLQLTPKALEIQALVAKEIDRFEIHLSRGLSEKERAAFFKTMKKIRSNIETMI